MKTKIIRIILPTTLGIVTVLGLLVIFNLLVHNGDAFNSFDNNFFKLFVPIATIIALIIQFALTLPFWKNLNLGKNYGIDTFSIYRTTMYTIRFNFWIGIWERDLGYNELILFL